MVSQKYLPLPGRYVNKPEMLIFRYARTVAGVLIVLAQLGCSTPQTRALQISKPSSLPVRVELSDVIFFPQEEYQCGPASLAMVFQKNGVSVNPAQLKDFVYLPQKKGSLQVEMLATTRRYGLVAYALAPNLQDVLAEISAGNPVIVLQNLGLSWHPLWHYAVAIGYDLQKEEIILRSGSVQRQVLSLTTFENTWARSHYWAMVALPVTRLAQTATPENTLKSLTALVQTSMATDAWPAYEAAILRWPDNVLVKIGAGNYAYKQGDLYLAKRIFISATQEHPESAAAYNNLAQTLSDLGQFEEAFRAIQNALLIGGPLEDSVRKTQQEIEQKKREAEDASLK